MSTIAIGTAEPGVVSAPRTATSPSAPPMTASQPSSADSASATAAIRLRLVRTIAASATAFSRVTSPASPPRTTAGTRVSTASTSRMRISDAGCPVMSVMVSRTPGGDRRRARRDVVRPRSARGARRRARPAAGRDRREHEVRGLVAQGLTDRQIATALRISAKTVEKHVGSLLRKTGARNRTMLVALAGLG